MNKPNPSAGGRYVLGDEGEHIRADASEHKQGLGQKVIKPSAPQPPALKQTGGKKHGTAK